MQIISILVCLVCKLKFCNVMGSLPLPKMCSHDRNLGCFVYCTK